MSSDLQTAICAFQGLTYKEAQQKMPRAYALLRSSQRDTMLMVRCRSSAVTCHIISLQR